ncbi:DUF2087 domain-containing protein [Brevibacillus daliensis]|uniref:DUF2087 domain-containing protein n=1 Tax=Brevibacillus daliensis TaxID=2892995 RepID=UPI001E5FC7B7|nr:DUF2087 domain-containing protein [Brevibacillus daliensis]
MSDLSTLFWNAPLDELKKGYTFDQAKQVYTCLICGKTYEQGIIYPHNELLFEAKKAAEHHVDHEHSSMFTYLIQLDKKVTGLSEIQRDLIKQFYQGMSDAEIVKSGHGTSNSTIRNHRYQLREKEKQAKVFLAIMSLMQEALSNRDRSKSSEEKKATSTTSVKTDSFLPVPPKTTFQDERFAMTEKEYMEILQAYFPDGLHGPLKEFPRKAKRKAAILRHILGRFERNKIYTEKEVNAILLTASEDHVTLRRYLIEYGFLDRKADGSEYWVVN